MPPYSRSTFTFLKQFLAGDKKLLKMKERKTMNMHRYEELKVKEILKQARAIPELNIYLPNEQGKGRLVSRTYLYSVLATKREVWLGTVL